MKAIMIVILLALVGCAVKPALRAHDTRWSDDIRETIMQCGVVAGKIADGDDILADRLFNQCLRDMNVTI